MFTSAILFRNILPQKIIIKHPNNKTDITKNCHIINPSSLYDMKPHIIRMIAKKKENEKYLHIHQQHVTLCNVMRTLLKSH